MPRGQPTARAQVPWQPLVPATAKAPKLFRRHKSDDAAVAAPVKEGGKGRPTPKRKEAEAAARARAKVPRTRKEQLRQQRQTRSESSRKVREAMKSGDERYFLPRDQGPVRRFIRDFVDSRFGVTEMVIPLLIATMILGYSGNSRLAGIGNTLLLGTILLLILDLVMLRLRLRKQLAIRFPEEPTKGTTYYAITRSMQMKFMRLPKSRVKIGQELPDNYR
jgi:hypothetical protein